MNQRRSKSSMNQYDDMSTAAAVDAAKRSVGNTSHHYRAFVPNRTFAQDNYGPNHSMRCKLNKFVHKSHDYHLPLRRPKTSQSIIPLQQQTNSARHQWEPVENLHPTMYGRSFADDCEGDVEQMSRPPLTEQTTPQCAPLCSQPIPAQPQLSQQVGWQPEFDYTSQHGKPVFRNGRVGSNWRHVTRVTGNLGNNIMYIDGVTKEFDCLNYPPHGYPHVAVKPRLVPPPAIPLCASFYAQQHHRPITPRNWCQPSATTRRCVAGATATQNSSRLAFPETLQTMPICDPAEFGAVGQSRHSGRVSRSSCVTPHWDQWKLPVTRQQC